MTCHDDFHDFHDSWYDSWFEWWCFVVASWTLSGTSVLFHALASIQSWQAELDRVAADNLKATQRSKWCGSDSGDLIFCQAMGDLRETVNHEMQDTLTQVPSIAFVRLRASSCALCWYFAALQRTGDFHRHWGFHRRYIVIFICMHILTFLTQSPNVWSLSTLSMLPQFASICLICQYLSPDFGHFFAFPSQAQSRIQEELKQREVRRDRQHTLLVLRCVAKQTGCQAFSRLYFSNAI